ncbi:MAG: UPF0158 family protein [Simkaniaceae bacterium]|nr:UPF0158 family protein [Simkaniaceae bacterium]
MTKKLPQAQNPLILRYHRLMEAFSKSDDERDFFLDRVEGFLVYIDLDRSEEELEAAYKALREDKGRFCPVPKLTFYETKKFMEGFVNEKVYDIDTKEKLLDIIGSKEPREHFIEFIYDHLTELDKWQQYFHERSRIRIIEWLRQCEVKFVFEEDVEIPKPTMEKLKTQLFEGRVGKDVQTARSTVESKAKTYYSNEALNPRPKRGRPPKQQAKIELEPQLTNDIYLHVPSALRSFLFIPDYDPQAITFSSKFDSEAEFLANLRGTSRVKIDTRLEKLSQRLESLRHLSGKLGNLGDSELAGEHKTIHEISAQEPDEEKPGVLSRIAQGLIPKKRGRPRKSADEAVKPRKKAVTPIKATPKKKK